MRSTNAKCDILNPAEMPSMHLVKLKISTRARNSSFQENYSCNCMFEYKRHPLQLLQVISTTMRQRDGDSTQTCLLFNLLNVQSFSWQTYTIRRWYTKILAKLGKKPLTLLHFSVKIQCFATRFFCFTQAKIASSNYCSVFCGQQYDIQHVHICKLLVRNRKITRQFVQTILGCIRLGLR